MANKFQTGNKVAEKWSEQKTVLVLAHLLNLLWRCDITSEQAPNPVRANTIKLRKEICLLGNITERQWQHFKKKFTNKTSQYYSNEISTIINKIEDTCECRLLYSGSSMDIFILKKHYGYTLNPNKVSKAIEQEEGPRN